MEAKPAQAKLQLSGSKLEKLYFEKSKWFSIGLFIFFALVTFILYSSSINNYYVVDDFVRLKVVSEGSLGENFHYIPVPLSIYRLSYLIFGPSPAPVRIISLVLNAFICVLVFKLSLVVFRHFAVVDKLIFLKSFLVSLFFCIHYIHLETIIYFADLHELLYTLFYLLGLYCYLRFRQDETKLYLFLVFLFYFLCIFSKETAVTFMLCILAADLFLFKKSFIVYIRRFYFLFIITLIFVAARYVAYPKLDAFSYSFSFTSLVSESLKNIIFVFTAFIVSLDFPVLRDIYRLNGANIMNSFKAVLEIYPIALAGLIFSFAVYIKILTKPSKIIYLSLIFIFITISSFIWLAGYERYLYLPSIGFFIMIIHHAFAVYSAAKYYRVIIPVVLFLLFVYNIYSLLQKKSNWESASEISRSIVENIVGLTGNLPSGSVVYFKDIPTEYKGAWVIRYEVHLFPELFLSRNDISFYYLYERPDVKKQFSKVYVYEYKSKNLLEE